MLARYRKGSSSSSGSSNRSRSGGSSRHSSGSAPAKPEQDDFGPIRSDEAGLSNNLNIAGILAAVVMLMIAEVPSVDGTLRKVLAQAGTAILLLLLALTRRWRPSGGGRLASHLLRAPYPALIALLGWTIFEFVRAPYRNFAAVELLRVLAGVAAFLLGAWSLRTARQAAWTTASLLGIGVLISLWDFGKIGQTDMGLRAAIDTKYSIFGTHEDVASLLVLLLPISLSFALTPAIEEKRRLAATASSLILGAALLVARTRTSWVGGLVALSVLALLTAWNMRSNPSVDIGDTRRGRGASPLASFIFSPVTMLLFGVLAFVLVGGAGPLIRSRALTAKNLAGDDSFHRRVESWEGAARMASEAPIAGRGLGSFPVIQGQWTHQGAEVQTVLNQQYGHESIAHDYYLQWAADNGLVGLILYIGTVVSALLGAVYAIPRIRAPFARALLLGSISAVAGGMVDALGSPAYNFFGVSTVFWLCIGLMITAAGLGTGASKAGEKPAVDPWWVWGGSVATGAAVAVAIVLLGEHMKSEGTRVPRGALTITLAPAGKIVSGDYIHWTAHFVDASGEELSTMPGTIWEVTGAPSYAHLRVALAGEPFGSVPWYLNHSTLSLVAPAGPPLVAHARYCDRYGRWYDAWSMAQATPAPLPVRKGK